MPHEANPILNQARKEAATVNVDTAIPATASDAVPEPAPVPKSSAQLQAVEEALAASSARIGTSIRELEAGLATTQTATDVITSAIGDITSANQITKATQNNAALQAQNATIAAFEVGGGTDAQTELMSTLREDGQRVATLLDEKQDIVDDEFTGIQLIDAIINEFRSVQTTQEIKAATAQQQQTSRQITNLGAATESFARTNAVTKRTLNEAVIEANYKAIAAEGDIKAAETELKNLNSNAAAMARLATADARNVSNLISAFRLEGEAEERILKQERQKFAREQMTFAREKWTIELPAAQVALEKARISLEDIKGLTPERRAALEANFNAATKRFNDLVATENTLVQQIQQGQSVSGTTIEDRETIIFGLKQPGDTGKKYIRLQEIGGAPDPVLGNDAFEAMNSITTVAPSGNIIQTPAMKTLEQVANAQAAVYKKAGKVPKDEEVVKSDFNTTAQIIMETAAENIQPGDATNPYQAPPMSVLEGAAAVASSTFYKKVLHPIGMKETNPQRIMDAAVAGVRSKTVSPEEAAAGIEAIFDTAAAHNNTMHGGFRRVGLPNQVTYNTQISRPATFFENLKITGGITKASPLLVLSPLAGQSAGLKKVLELGEAPFSIVDLMDGAQIKSALVQLLSATPPDAPVDTSAEPSEKQTATVPAPTAATPPE